MAKSSVSGAHVRWTADDARRLLAEQERSGLSLWRFATERGIEPERLYRWRRKLQGDEQHSAQFVEVRSEGGVRLEIVLRSGHHVLVRAPVDVDALRAIVVVLEGEC